MGRCSGWAAGDKPFASSWGQRQRWGLTRSAREGGGGRPSASAAPAVVCPFFFPKTCLFAWWCLTLSTANAAESIAWHWGNPSSEASSTSLLSLLLPSRDSGSEHRDGFRLFTLPLLEQGKRLQNTQQVKYYIKDVNTFYVLRHAAPWAALVACPRSFSPP